MNQKRYLGLELSGAKNAKTTLAVLEYYPKEKKVFLLDVHSGIGASENQNSDEALVSKIQGHAEGHPDFKLGVSVPLTLPPLFNYSQKKLTLEGVASLPEVKWMNQYVPKKRTTSKRNAAMKDFFTPYTQRPVELWLKHEVLSKLPPRIRFDIDETLGGNRAPLTARMHYLKLFLDTYEMHEVLPKLTVALLGPYLKITQKILYQYRQLEDGVTARETILEKMSENLDIFIYDRDMKKITQSLNSFDAFLCAYTVMLFDRNECVPAPKGFPVKSGWVRYPKSPLLDPHKASQLFVPDEGEGEE